MKRVAIVGAGPTGIYTLHSLLASDVPIEIAIYEAADEAGVGMPYSDDLNSRLMLANIASIEIPPLISPYLDWLRDQSPEMLSRYGVEKAGLHDRQFLPRILLGQYFRDQFLTLVSQARDRGHVIDINEARRVTDVEVTTGAVHLWAEDDSAPLAYDMAVIATGHVWPDDDETPRAFFPSPWSGMLEAEIPAGPVGIMGTSLSAIDAAMAVAAQHGRFVEEPDESLRFDREVDSDDLTITLMSRTGILPEADFYCPIPYAPLEIATEARIADEIAAGGDGLLDRLFALIQQEIAANDPVWAASVNLADLDAESFADAYFADRIEHDPFRWAAYNLREVERNKRDRRTVPWRYAILRLHEAVQDAVPHLDEADRERFDAGISRVFVDNYAAVPSESIRRLLALRAAGLIDVIELGPDYDMTVEDGRTTIVVGDHTHRFDIFIDARGQKPLGTRDLPFPRLRSQLLANGDEIPDVGDDYTLMAPDLVKGRVALGAIPYLMHDQPFVQGITASADIGRAIARAATAPSSRRRRRLAWFEG